MRSSLLLKGRVEIQLSTVTRITSYAQIQVSDTGKGIAPDFLPQIFDRFQQPENITSRPQEGLGLGLAIVRNLVELHGGTVSAESLGEGRGATFTVKIPLLETAGEAERNKGRILIQNSYTPHSIKNL